MPKKTIPVSVRYDLEIETTDSIDTVRSVLVETHPDGKLWAAIEAAIRTALNDPDADVTVVSASIER